MNMLAPAVRSLPNVPRTKTGFHTRMALFCASRAISALALRSPLVQSLAGSIRVSVALGWSGLTRSGRPAKALFAIVAIVVVAAVIVLDANVCMCWMKHKIVHGSDTRRS